MFRCEKARRVLLVDKVKLNMAALLVLAVACFLPLHGEQDCAGTHAWESLCLAYFAAPAWCVAFLYRPHCLEKWGRDMVVFGVMAGYEALLICWHAPLLWGVRCPWYWHSAMLNPGMEGQGEVWGWLPVHACMLALAIVGAYAVHRLKKNMI